MLSIYPTVELHLWLNYIQPWNILANTILVVILWSTEMIFLTQKHTGPYISISPCPFMFPQVTHWIAPGIQSMHLKYEENNCFNTLKSVHQLLMKRQIWIVLFKSLLKSNSSPCWAEANVIPGHVAWGFISFKCEWVGPHLLQMSRGGGLLVMLPSIASNFTRHDFTVDNPF